MPLLEKKSELKESEEVNSLRYEYEGYSEEINSTQTFEFTYAHTEVVTKSINATNRRN